MNEGLPRLVLDQNGHELHDGDAVVYHSTRGRELGFKIVETLGNNRARIKPGRFGRIRQVGGESLEYRDANYDLKLVPADDAKTTTDGV